MQKCNNVINYVTQFPFKILANKIIVSGKEMRIIINCFTVFQFNIFETIKLRGSRLFFWIYLIRYHKIPIITFSLNRCYINKSSMVISVKNTPKIGVEKWVVLELNSQQAISSMETLWQVDFGMPGRQPKLGGKPFRNPFWRLL